MAPDTDEGIIRVVGLEEECDLEAAVEQFKCNNGACIPHFYHCNKIWECPDGVDEVGCDYQASGKIFTFFFILFYLPFSRLPMGTKIINLVLGKDLLLLLFLKKAFFSFLFFFFFFFVNFSHAVPIFFFSSFFSRSVFFFSFVLLLKNSTHSTHTHTHTHTHTRGSLYFFMKAFNNCWQDNKVVIFFCSAKLLCTIHLIIFFWGSFLNTHCPLSLSQEKKNVQKKKL